MSAAPKLYFVTVTITPSKEGIDLPRFIQKISGILEDYSNATHVVHKFKVTGEAKILAVIQVSNILGFERTIGGLWRLGSVQVTSTPIVNYENFAQYLGVDPSIVSAPSRPLPKESLYWWSFNIEYGGKTTEDLLATWRREADFVMSARAKDGFPIELYKVASERKVHCFLQVDDPARLDQMVYQLPIIRENGQNVTLECRAIQYLNDYCQRIMSESL
ncbi:uncharacterized protein LOC112570169 [Pomacea canaliculata]|uniref:uncharacterized protein LOC112570169 n=1 Tax=Pomacea canaliculata TaxID=400727 RepID=UPI000D73D2E8|nr:uncharacterized protein LOC112570169 [Pomacea canaliculata]